MKKIITIFFIVISCLVYSQQELSHSIYQYNFTGNEWVNNHIKKYDYDEKGNLISKKLYSWDDDLSDWKSTFFESHIYEYNNNNKIVRYQVNDFSEVNFVYNSNDLLEEYSNDSSKFVFDYNSENQIVRILRYYKTYSDEWALSRKLTLTYLNNLPDKIEVYNSSESLIDEITYTYNENKNLIEIKNSSTKLSLDLDSNNNITKKNHSNYSSILGGWYTSAEESYSLNSTEVMSDFIHPFKDKTGIDNQFGYFLNLFYPNEFGASFFNDYYSNNKLNYYQFDSTARNTFYYNDITANTTNTLLKEIMIGPNPIKDFVQIDLNKNEIQKIEIYNLLGKKVIITDEPYFNVSSLNKGIYLLKVETITGESLSKKIIKM